MQALILKQPQPIEHNPLELVELPNPLPAENEIQIKVSTCGLCHTDLHIIEGELPLPKLPIIPGHQIVGIVTKLGDKVTKFKLGDRVGVAWLASTCGECEFCKTNRENLCEHAQFTGYHKDGGYAEYTTANAEFVYSIPEIFSDEQAAPLLCAGVIGYRALKLSNIEPGGKLGLFGFGASAHIVIQIAIHYLECKVYVFTRNVGRQELARQLGAVWVGNPQDTPPTNLDSAIIFAPVGTLVPIALNSLKKGGTLALAGIYMTPIPEIDYKLLYHERVLRSVANSTREDAIELLKLAEKIPLQLEIETFNLEEVNIALQKLKASQLRAPSGVVKITN